MAVAAALTPVSALSLNGLDSSWALPAPPAASFPRSLLLGYVQDYSFAPAFLVCGVLYPVGLANILLTVRRAEPMDG